MLVWRKPTQKCQVWVQSKTRQQFPAWCEKLPSLLVFLGTVSCMMASTLTSAGQLELTGGAAALESHKSTVPHCITLVTLILVCYILPLNRQYFPDQVKPIWTTSQSGHLLPILPPAYES